MTPALNEQGGRTVQVVPLLRLHHLGDRRFDYLLPSELAPQTGVGSVVYVPFGRRTVRAVVVAEGQEGETSLSELRAVLAVKEERVPADLMILAEAVSRRYLSSYESCLRLVAPPDRGRGSSGTGAAPRKTWVRAVPQRGRREDGEAEEATGRLTAKQRALLEAVPPEGIPAAALCVKAGVGRSVLNRLVERGFLALGDAPPSSGAGDTSPTSGPDDSPAAADSVAAPAPSRSHGRAEGGGGATDRGL